MTRSSQALLASTLVACVELKGAIKIQLEQTPLQTRSTRKIRLRNLNQIQIGLKHLRGSFKYTFYSIY